MLSANTHKTQQQTETLISIHFSQQRRRGKWMLENQLLNPFTGNIHSSRPTCHSLTFEFFSPMQLHCLLFQSLLLIFLLQMLRISTKTNNNSCQEHCYLKSVTNKIAMWGDSMMFNALYGVALDEICRLHFRWNDFFETLKPTSLNINLFYNFERPNFP